MAHNAVDISAVVLTRDRPTRCMDSVWHNALAMNGLRSEIIVVNNGKDQVPLPAFIGGVPCRILQMRTNLGAEARNEGVRIAQGQYLLILDDDSYMDPGLPESMITAMDANPGIGAAAFRVRNGTKEESCLLPTVFHGCACGFRRSALESVGGYPSGYMYYGEEYDVAFRLYQAGFRIALCKPSQFVRHERDTGGRSNDRILHMLIRNNTHLWFKFLPSRHIRSAMQDTLHRYTRVADKEQAQAGLRNGLRTIPWAALRGLRYRTPMTETLFKKISLADKVEDAAIALEKNRRNRVVICGIGKFPSLWASILESHGIQVLAFWDHNPCWKGTSIQGIPVRVADDQLPTPPDDVSFLTGTASLAENALWEEQMQKGLHLDTNEGGILRHGAATSSRGGTFDLSDSCRISLFSKHSLIFAHGMTCGIQPATAYLARV